MAHELPPPAVMRSQRNMNSGSGATNDAFGNTDEWQPIDYWYNRVLSKSSPAANTANPSALGLIAFGYTTALLQVNFNHVAFVVVDSMLSRLFSVRRMVACIPVGPCAACQVAVLSSCKSFPTTNIT